MDYSSSQVLALTPFAAYASLKEGVQQALHVNMQAVPFEPMIVVASISIS